MDNQSPTPEPFRAPDAVGAVRPEDFGAVASPAPSLADAEARAKDAAREVEQLVDEWFRKHFHGLGARLDEALYNHLHAAKEELKQLLRGVA